MSLSVIILTFNAENTIGPTLASAAEVSDDIHVVDSGSTDGTLAIIAEHGARLVSHPFEDYGKQRNWAIDNLPLKHGWQLHLDADERLTPELTAAIKAPCRHYAERSAKAPKRSRMESPVWPNSSER